MNKLVNILRRNGYQTIEDIANVSEHQLRLIKYMGEQTFELLFSLLMFLSCEEPAQNKDKVLIHT
ncbi:helix-hairpin-helix domain-containing protein [Paenibacillus lacisoli]|nr:helix-hairpin-helix domain-containing protein [Paenibacillus sp. JX-17]